VLGADVTARSEWKPFNPTLGSVGDPLYDYRAPFLDSFVAFGFLAAVTKTLAINSSVLVLPMRQTALIAKQAAVADVLTGGRVRLGVGVGWNDVEYEAMGADFRSRGRRIDEQIALLRAFWTNEIVNFRGDFHTIKDAGINPLPVQRPIPLWIGGSSDAAMERAARLSDGWIPGSGLLLREDSRVKMAEFWEQVRKHGRDPKSVALVGIVRLEMGEPEAALDQIRRWAEHAATHINFCFRASSSVSSEIDAQLEALRRVRKAWAAACLEKEGGS
jgi:probable F420-dependent oxidoreductase